MGEMDESPKGSSVPSDPHDSPEPLIDIKPTTEEIEEPKLIPETVPSPQPEISTAQQEDELDFEEGQESTTQKQPKVEEDDDGEIEDSDNEIVDDQIKSENKTAKEEKSDGELEDGEVSDSDDDDAAVQSRGPSYRSGDGSTSQGQSGGKSKSVCRFYGKGQCTWGTACRFLHPGLPPGAVKIPTDPNVLQGKYPGTGAPLTLPLEVRLAASVSAVAPSGGSLLPEPTIGFGYDTRPVGGILPLPTSTLQHQESSWERGLRGAKDMRERAHQRKDDDDYYGRDRHYPPPLPPAHPGLEDEFGRHPRSRRSPSPSYERSYPDDRRPPRPLPPNVRSNWDEEDVYERRRRIALEAAPWNDDLDAAPPSSSRPRSHRSYPPPVPQEREAPMEAYNDPHRASRKRHYKSTSKDSPMRSEFSGTASRSLSVGSLSGSEHEPSPNGKHDSTERVRRPHHHSSSSRIRHQPEVPPPIMSHPPRPRSSHRDDYLPPHHVSSSRHIRPHEDYSGYDSRPPHISRKKPSGNDSWSEDDSASGSESSPPIGSPAERADERRKRHDGYRGDAPPPGRIPKYNRPAYDEDEPIPLKRPRDVSHSSYSSSSRHGPPLDAYPPKERSSSRRHPGRPREEVIEEGRDWVQSTPPTREYSPDPEDARYPPPPTRGKFVRAMRSRERTHSGSSDMIGQEDDGNEGPDDSEVSSPSIENGNAPPGPATKPQKTSRREELLKQLKQVEEAIAKRKKTVPPT